MRIVKLFMLMSAYFSIWRAQWSHIWKYGWSNNVWDSRQKCLDTSLYFIFWMSIMFFFSLCMTFWFIHREIKRKCRLFVLKYIEADLRRRHLEMTIESISNEILKMENDAIEPNYLVRDKIDSIGITFKSRNDILSKRSVYGVNLIKESAKRKSYLNYNSLFHNILFYFV